MSKQALCADRDSIKIDFNSSEVQDIPNEFFDIQTRLVGRDKCETDPSLLQLIPYMVLRDALGKVLCYRRGSGGGEGRLHEKLSVGLGGHVDIGPSELQPLYEVLLREAQRELLEEVGVDVMIRGFHGLIYTGSAGGEVDQVHLGIVSDVFLEDEEALALEDGIIEGAEFLTLNELLSPETFDLLEPWSQAVVRGMRDQLSKNVGELMGTFGTLLMELNITSQTGATSSATQEVAGVMRALGRNLMLGHAHARIYDTESAGYAIESLLCEAESCASVMGFMRV